ncbi:hypothetical protein BDB01DRAFT_834590 [Pilobolus umbonatus]|nr:hypothetical protein BDB01DRAFT_834590 [Pilobolus umbonatus]
METVIPFWDTDVRHLLSVYLYEELLFSTFLLIEVRDKVAWCHRKRILYLLACKKNPVFQVHILCTDECLLRVAFYLHIQEIIHHVPLFFKTSFKDNYNHATLWPPCLLCPITTKSLTDTSHFIPRPRPDMWESNNENITFSNSPDNCTKEKKKVVMYCGLYIKWT